jgi:AraC-like DNA-binding protein
MPATPVLLTSAGRRLHRADTCDPLKAAIHRGEVRVGALSRRGYPGLRLPERSLREICSIGVWDATGSQSWGLDWHCNEGVELTVLLHGRLSFALGEAVHALQPGQLTITRPWQPHRLGNPEVEPSRLFWLILDVGVRQPDQPWRWPRWLVCSPEELERLTILLSHNEQPVWDADSELRSCIETLSRRLLEAPQAMDETRLKLAINEVLVSLLSMLSTRRIPLDRELASSRRTVGMFLDGLGAQSGEEWDLATMAAHCNLARSRFTHYCRQLVNMTPMEYLTRLRIERARSRLRSHPQESITQVAFTCGFQSSQYFATIFRRATGASPTEYRRSPAPATGSAHPTRRRRSRP